MALTYAQYINYAAKKLKNYINYLVDFNNEYNEKLKEMHKNYQSDVIHKSDEMIQLEKEIKEAYDNATSLYNDLKRIADKYKNGMNIDNAINSFRNQLNRTHLPTYENVTLNAVQTIKLKPVNNSQEGVITGGAAMPTNPTKADFSKLERPFAPNMLLNENLNKNIPDAKELANIFLVSPKRVPKSKEYKYIPPSSSCILNSKYNLTGNKKIDNFWSGFAYSKYSTLAKNVSNYSDLKNQLIKHYSSSTKQYNTDKIDVNFDNDKNLHLALGHATILKPTIDKKGYFHGILFDKYDFDLKFKGIYKDSLNTLAIDYFWLLQQIYKNKNFYVLAPIVFKW